jgi:LPXTG-motif cell wall-anchored protein
MLELLPYFSNNLRYDAFSSYSGTSSYFPSIAEESKSSSTIYIAAGGGTFLFLLISGIVVILKRRKKKMKALKLQGTIL